LIKIPGHVVNLKPYKAGKPIEELQREKGLKKIVKLASNENPLGPSPLAADAVLSHLSELHRYTDPSAYKLVHKIAEKYNKKTEQVVTGSGSDSLLQYIVTAFSDNDDEILTSEGTFIGWYVNTDKYGRRSILVPLNNYHYDMDAMGKAVTERTKIIYLANPNNPTGTMFTRQEFDKFIKQIPSHILIVLDEAYTVYAEHNPDYPNGLEYELDNLIVLRTLSKAYGLAGLRVGFGIGPGELIKELYKVKLPFEPNALAQAAAIAAFEDTNFLKRTIELNHWSLKKMQRLFDELEIKHVPTAANFILMLFPSEEIAASFNNECLNRGLILRHVNTFGIPNGIRINSGTEDETEFALSVIREVHSVIQQKYINNIAAT
jgi:histidinol-phosphate aminotransferase